MTSSRRRLSVWAVAAILLAGMASCFFLAGRAWASETVTAVDEGLLEAARIDGEALGDGPDGREEAAAESVQHGQQALHRLYNVRTGEHFYTGNEVERDGLLSEGWFYEGVGWVSPLFSSRPVYRLYNPNAGDHHYTANRQEREILLGSGWLDEGVGWYSDEGESLAVYRVYNPATAVGTHHFTCNEIESGLLGQAGWSEEGPGWYALFAGWAGGMSNYSLGNLYALADTVGRSQPGVNVGYGTEIGWDKINDVAGRLGGATVAFVAVNARTGRSIAYNPDQGFYGASTIKAPYIAALCKYSAPGIWGLRNTFYNVITYSSNEGFNSLCARYGRFYERLFAQEAGFDLDFAFGSGGYVNFTPRQLALMWLHVRDFVLNGGVNAQLFWDSCGNGLYKEGWMYNGMWGGQVYHLAGIEGDTVYAVMTRYLYRDSRVWEMKDALVRAVS